VGVRRFLGVRHPLEKVGARAKNVIFRARVKYEVRTPVRHCYMKRLGDNVTGRYVTTKIRFLSTLMDGRSPFGK
jgi:hypothetical protein